MYKKIGLALAFSPRCQAMLAEAYRLKKLFDSELFCIHIGPKGKAEEEFLTDVLDKAHCITVKKLRSGKILFFDDDATLWINAMNAK